MRLLDITQEQSLSDAGLSVYEGWNEKLACDLVVASVQPHIKRYTPNDAAKRFVSLESANEWYTVKNHTTYSLYHSDTLAGIIWFRPGPKPELGAEYSFAIRLYEDAIGKGLAYPFARIAHHDYAVKVGLLTVWLETDGDNAAALHLYKKLGYQKVGEHDGRITMVKK